MIRRLAWAMLLVLLSWPSSPAQGQTPAKMPRIGLLSIGTDPARPLPPQWVAFFDGLRQHGYVEGQTIAVERRFAGGKAERLTELAAGLVQQKVDVIVVTGPREVEAAHRATTTIPIVTIVAHDLVATGLVASLGRPGGTSPDRPSARPGSARNTSSSCVRRPPRSPGSPSSAAARRI